MIHKFNKHTHTHTKQHHSSLLTTYPQSKSNYTTSFSECTRIYLFPSSIAAPHRLVPKPLRSCVCVCGLCLCVCATLLQFGVCALTNTRPAKCIQLQKVRTIKCAIRRLLTVDSQLQSHRIGGQKSLAKTKFEKRNRATESFN